MNLRGALLVVKLALPAPGEGGSVVFIGSLAGCGQGAVAVLRRVEGGADRAEPPRRARGCAAGRARERRRAGADRHGAWARRVGRPAGARAKARIPLGRQGRAWEVAYAARFLLSDEASYVTGQTIVVDGGLGAL